MKDCPPGKYFCNKEKKCMPIPKGHYVGARGWLRPDPEDEDGNGNGKKSKGGKKNGNGHSGTNGSSSGNGNGNGNGAAGGGMSEDKKWIQKATKNMRKDKPCTGEKFGSETCPPGSKRYNLAKTFRKMAKNEEVELDEGGMSRQVQHSKSRSTAQLTATRGDKSSKENKARNKELGKKVRSMGYGYKKVKGEYPETDSKTGEKKTVKEPSITVNAPKKKFKKFRKQMKRLGKEYNQDTVITKKGKDKATLHPTNKRAGKKGSKIGQIRPGKTGKFGHTKVGSKTYTYEATTLPRINGQTMYVTFQWRGKYMSIQMFFPELKVPSKKEVQDAVVKVYPGSRVMDYDVVLRDPTKPILQLPEDIGSKSSSCPSIDQVQSKQIAQKKENMVDKKKEVLQKIQAIRSSNIK